MSYPGEQLASGATSTAVRALQIQLNRISRNYPAIPKIPNISGIYDIATQEAVRAFQEIFDLAPTGTVNKATWYRIAYIFTSVKRLAELDSAGITYEEHPFQFTQQLSPGDEGEAARAFQYFLAVVGAYYEAVLPIQITDTYDAQTEASVHSFQQVYGLP